MLENLVAAASADAVLLTLAPALPVAVPDVPAAGTPALPVITLLKTELPRAFTLAAFPIPLTVTWLLALSAVGGVPVLLLLETNDPEITPLAASLADAEVEYSLFALP